MRLLAGAVDSFTRHLLVGLAPREGNIARGLANSLMLVTALAPAIGYDAAAAIAKHAHEAGLSLREAALASGKVDEAQYDRLVRPENMLGPDR